MKALTKLRQRLFGLSKEERRQQEQRLLAFFAVATAVAVVLAVVVGPWLALGAVIGLLAVALTIARPELTLLFYAVYTPFEPFLLKFVPDELYVFARYFSEGLIYIMVLAVMIRVIARRQKMASTPIDLPFILFIVVALTSLLLNSVEPVYGILGLRQIIRFILLFFVVVNLKPERTFIRQLTYAMFGVMVFQGLLGLVQAFVGAPLDEFLIPSERKFYESIQLTSGTSQFWSPGARVFATMGRFDQLGTFLSFFFLIAAGLWYKSKDPQRRNRILLMVGLAFPALILTLSRASWFGFMLGLFVIGAVLMRDRRLQIVFATLVITALSYLAFTGLAVRYLTDYPEQTVVERFFEAFSYERWRGEYYGYGRLYWIVKTATVVVPSSPLFGVGPGQYGAGAAAALGNVTVYQRLNLPFGVYGTDGYIDNNWFALWGETGTLGLAFYVWMFIALGLMCLRVLWHSKDKLAQGLALGFIGCLFAVTFQAFLATYLEVRTLALYLWMFAGFIYVLGERDKVFSRKL